MENLSYKVFARHSELCATPLGQCGLHFKEWEHVASFLYLTEARAYAQEKSQSRAPVSCRVSAPLYPYNGRRREVTEYKAQG